MSICLFTTATNKNFLARRSSSQSLAPPALISSCREWTANRSTYDILRVPSSSPFWLVVVVLPRDVRRWASHSKASLILRRCTYWHSLEGYPEIITESATVRIPEEQRFTVECLQATMLALESTP